MDPAWLPRLLRLDESGGDWTRFCESVYSIFARDFIGSQPQLEGRWVRCRRDPLYEGKEAGFWHCVQEGADEDSRSPDIRRCERIAWVRALIEHANDPQIQAWRAVRGTDNRRVLWFREEFVVVLGERTSRGGREYFQLITAYCTDRQHTKQRLRNESARSKNG